MMVNDEHCILLIKLLCAAVPYMMVNDEHYILLIKLLCPAVPYMMVNDEHYILFKNSLIIHEQDTKEIIAVKESLYVIKHT